MELSSIIRAVGAAARAVIGKISPLFSERAAGKEPEIVQSIDKAIARNTIERVGGGKPDDALDSRILNFITHKIISPEFLDNPNVRSWLNDQDVKDDLEHGARLKSLGKPLSEEVLSRLQYKFEKVALCGAQESMSVVSGIIAIMAQASLARVGDLGNASLISANYRELSTEISALRTAWESHYLVPQTREMSEFITDGLKRNISWLSEAFGSSKRARSVFGQPLSPGDESVTSTIDREALRTQITSKIFKSASGAVVGLLGGDGNGKSWIFAQA